MTLETGTAIGLVGVVVTIFSGGIAYGIISNKVNKNETGIKELKEDKVGIKECSVQHTEILRRFDANDKLLIKMDEKIDTLVQHSMNRRTGD